MTNKSCNKGLKYCKFMTTRNKENVMKNDHYIKHNITTKYIEYKHKILDLVLSPFTFPDKIT